MGEAGDWRSMSNFVLLHGFASSSGSRKAQYFAERFDAMPRVDFRAFDFNPTPADFERMTISGMIHDLERVLEDRQLESVSLIGSSMGALVALHIAKRFQGVERMLLLAPALSYRALHMSARELERWKHKGELSVWHYGFEKDLPLNYAFHRDGLQYSRQIPPPVPITIVHGVRDETVPIELSRGYASKYPDQVQMYELDTDHRMNDRLDEIWEIARRVLLGEEKLAASDDE